MRKPTKFPESMSKRGLDWNRLGLQIWNTRPHAFWLFICASMVGIVACRKAEQLTHEPSSHAVISSEGKASAAVEEAEASSQGEPTAKVDDAESSSPTIEVAKSEAPWWSTCTGPDLGSMIFDRSTQAHDESLLLFGESILAPDALARVYAATLGQPIWLGTSNDSAHLMTLVDALEAIAIEHGLGGPPRYHLHAIRNAVEEMSEASLLEQSPCGFMDRWASLDLALTDSALSIFAHLAAGRVDPETVEPDWSAKRSSIPVVPLIHQIQSGSDLRELVQVVQPSQPEYAKLVERAETLREMIQSKQEYRPLASPGPQPSPESTTSLVQRLRLLGDLSEDGEPDADAIAAAIRNFQARHGLEPSGDLNAPTLAALNRPAEERLRTIEANLERWRWMPHKLGDRYILVNIADFTLIAVDDGEVVLRMPVVVGKEHRQTPVLSSEIDVAVFNPSWGVPSRIAREDLLPKIKKDPEFLARGGFRVFDKEGREVDLGNVQWSKVSKRNFQYRLRQKPGSANALGRMKFLFPNRHDVYLHDTSMPEYFEEIDRARSSGCIRVGKPLELAQFILIQYKDNQNFVAEQLNRGKEIRMQVRPKVPVHLQYWTAWIDEKGILQIRDDRYGRDRRLLSALAVDHPDAKN